jgi:glycosyltransferase involved in cell wall biosynthesis
MINKRICILTSVHPVFDARIFHKEARTLANAGYDITLIAQYKENTVIEGIRIIALPKPKNRFFRIFFTDFRLYFLAFRQKAAVYHFHDPELIPVALLLKITTKGKIIYDVHEDYPESILSKYWLTLLIRKPVAYLFDIIEKHLSFFFDHIITATENISTKFRKNKRVSTIYNYPIPEKIELSLCHNWSQPALIYVGGLTIDRGISEIVQAMTYLQSGKDTKLMLYGKFEPEDYYDELKREPGFDQTEYMGWIEPDKLWHCMGKAVIGIICLHPIDRYMLGLPVKLFEYMAAGLPVIASNFPIWEKIINSEKCGLVVNPLNPIEIAEAIDYLMKHQEEAIEMGQNGRKAIIEKYNWKSEDRKLLIIYREILSS